jgi:hypothetical protein
MIRQLTVTAVLFLLAPTSTDAVEPGRYALLFRMGSDFAGGQEIEILNLRRRSDSYGSFDVRVDAEGSLKRFAEDGQTVQGLYYDGKIIFIIPQANVVDVIGFKFVADDDAAASSYEGTVSIFGRPAGLVEGPFPFTMEKVVPVGPPPSSVP